MAGNAWIQDIQMLKADGTTPQTGSDGSNGILAIVDGLSNSIEKVGASETKTADIKGFRLLNKGTGDLTISASDGGTNVVVLAAELTAMGDAAYRDWPVRCDAITTGAGMTAIVYL